MSDQAQVDAIPPWLAKCWRLVPTLSSFLFLFLTLVDIALLALFAKELLFGESVLTDNFGLNKWAAKAIEFLLISPLLWHVGKKLEAHWKKTKLSFWFHVRYVVLSCLFFAAMFWLQKNVYFTTKGEALQYYSVTYAGRMQMCPGPGFDPKTGRPCNKAGPEAVALYQSQEAGLVPKPVSPADYRRLRYNTISGAPQVWYSRQPDGSFNLQDRLGFDGTLGILMQPIDRKVDEEILAWIDSQANAERQRAAAVAHEGERKARKEAEDRAAAERLAYIDRYLDRNSHRIAGKSNVAVRLIDSNDANSESVASLMDRALRDRGFNVLPLFKPAFGSDGLDRQLFEGNPSLAQRLALAEYCDSVVIGSVRMVMAPRRGGGMFITEMALQLRQISSGGERMDQTEIREKGGALDPQSSISAAIEKLAESAGAEMAAWPRT